MERLNSLLKSADYESFLQRNAEAELTRLFCRHTFDHMLDVARIAYVLLLEARSPEDWLNENGLSENAKASAKELVYCAGLLHDIGRWEECLTGESHAVISARLAAKLMLEHGFTESEISMVTAAIAEHRTSVVPNTALGHYVQLADRLSRRCFSCTARAQCNKLHLMPTAENLIY